MSILGLAITLVVLFCVTATSRMPAAYYLDLPAVLIVVFGSAGTVLLAYGAQVGVALKAAFSRRAVPEELRIGATVFEKWKTYALAWGFARAADRHGVDIIQNCEVTGIRRKNGAVTGVETSRGFIAAPKVGVVAAGHSSVLATMAGLRMPIESHPLQALVSEPLKPVLDTVIMSNAVHGYISQSDKGELVIGAGIDAYTGYGQRGSFSIIEGNVSAIVELFPAFSRVRMLRQWGGIVDVCPDACPIISRTPVKGLYFNCGWGTGGFKATPGSGWVFAYTIARDAPHRLNAAFDLERFYSGALIDEHGAAGVAH